MDRAASPGTRWGILELIMKIIDLTLTHEDGMRGVAFENAKSKSLWQD